MSTPGPVPGPPFRPCSLSTPTTGEITGPACARGRTTTLSDGLTWHRVHSLDNRLWVQVPFALDTLFP